LELLVKGIKSGLLKCVIIDKVRPGLKPGGIGGAILRGDKGPHGRKMSMK